MQEVLRSLAEIEQIERAYSQGVPALGYAAAELLRRWRYPLRDSETFLRLAFLSWYRESEPDSLTGLTGALPSVDDLISDRGGEESLHAEELFTLACLWSSFSPLGAGEEASGRRIRRMAERATSLEPGSKLFSEWPFCLGEADHTEAARQYLEQEVHARYAGRGAMGDYVAHVLFARLRSNRTPQPR